MYLLISKLYIMKRIFSFLAAIFLAYSSQSQKTQVESVEIGDKFVLGEPAGTNYSYVAVPRKNFIIKRGGLPNISSLKNTSIVVTDITYGKKTRITFKRANDKKFFRIYKTFTADLQGAIQTGELIAQKDF